jgi:hypothetical protein
MTEAADHPEIRFLGDLQRLEVRPGDVFVLTVPRDFSREVQYRIVEYWRGIMGDVRLIVLEEGMKLGVISEAA